MFIPEGIVPVRALNPIDKYSNFLKLRSAGGNDPLNRFSLRSKERRLIQFPIAAGIVP